jgi:hypothetical protein
LAKELISEYAEEPVPDYKKTEKETKTDWINTSNRIGIGYKTPNRQLDEVLKGKNYITL